jgi:hypothetical protein
LNSELRKLDASAVEWDGVLGARFGAQERSGSVDALHDTEDKEMFRNRQLQRKNILRNIDSISVVNCY